MKVSDIMTKNVFTLSSEDTIGRALTIMYNKRINQIPIIDKYRKYLGTVFAKDFLNVNTTTSSKVKNFLSKTPILCPSDGIKKCIQLIVTTGNRALPVVEDSKLIGIISETDVIAETNFGDTLVDDVMVGPIMIEDETALDSALAKMRRYKISRLPVVNSNGVLVGVINALDKAKIMATPKERIAKDSWTSSVIPAARQVKVGDIIRKMKFVKMGTKLSDVLESFKEFEEIIVVNNRRKPIGIVTARDALEMTLPRADHPSIHIANVSDYEVRSIIEANLLRFLNKIHGKRENVKSLLVYADKYKTRKHTLRARLISNSHVIAAKAVDYDPSSASKKLISVLDRRMKSESGKKVRQRQMTSVRHLQYI